MSGGPPPPHSTANLYGFGASTGAGNLGPVGAEIPASQMSTDPGGLMSMPGSSMFPSFDSLPMNLDLDDPTVVQPFPGVPVPAPPQVLVEPAGVDPVFGPEETVLPNLPNPGSLSTTGNATPSQSNGAASGNSSNSGSNSGSGGGLGNNSSNNNNNNSGGNNGGGSSSGSSSNILTEFTKRRNWPAKVVEELQDVLQILDADGKIKFVSPSILALTGYKAEEILNKFYQQLIHADDSGVFTAELNESIATGNPLRLFYRFKKKDDSYIIFESVGHAHIAAAKFAPNPNNQSPFCQAVFVMSRSYPTKNTSLLDSFLEHKIENERLRRRIAELRKEEADDAEESHRTWRQSQEGRSDIAPSEDTTITGATPLHHHAATSPEASAMPPPERPTAQLNAALTRENLEGIVGGRPDSIREKMARYEGSSRTDTIEMLTGLRYLEGERSRGITTGNASPSLVTGDAGIAMPMDRDPRTGEKKKKVKVAEEYVCTDCGTLESPEWRKGPSGPKTLCNACGLRWAKKEKKKNNNSLGHSGGTSGASGGGLAESAA